MIAWLAFSGGSGLYSLRWIGCITSAVPSMKNLTSGCSGSKWWNTRGDVNVLSVTREEELLINCWGGCAATGPGWWLQREGCLMWIQPRKRSKELIRMNKMQATADASSKNSFRSIVHGHVFSASGFSARVSCVVSRSSAQLTTL